MENIYLVGMMGSGKSVTGKALAKILDQPFLDLDEAVQKKEGRTIAEIFAGEGGEKHFRDLETQALIEVSKKEKVVVATGGGIILRKENIDLMKESGKIIYLETSIDFLWNRVKHKADRPLLSGGDGHEKLKRIFADREPVYKSVSFLTVGTDGLTAEAVAENINKEMGK